ncbi:MAG: hypothetical protein ACI9IN_001485 [Porticoccaceae bacterium]
MYSSSGIWSNEASGFMFTGLAGSTMANNPSMLSLTYYREPLSTDCTPHWR